MSSQTNKDKLNEYTGHCSNMIFHGFDTVVGVLVLVDSILLLLRMNSFVGFILPIYFAVFGILIIVFVLYAPSPLYASLIFYFNFCGRGLTFLFIGSVVLTFGDDLSLATGIIAIIVAFAYLFFSIWTKFCNLKCSLPVPLMQSSEGLPDPQSNAQPASNGTNAQINEEQPSNHKPVSQAAVNVNIHLNDQQQYGSAHDDDAIAPIVINNDGPQLTKDDAKELNDCIMNSFGKDINNLAKQTVPGYNAPIPTVLVMLEQVLHDSGGYKKRRIFHPDTIAQNKEHDEAYLMSHNIIAFFSELPSPLLSFVSSTVFEAGVNKDAMWRVLEQIPMEQAAVTQFIWDILAKVATFESNTNMNSQQLGQIFGPLMTLSPAQIQNDMLTASKMIVC